MIPLRQQVRKNWVFSWGHLQKTNSRHISSRRCSQNKCPVAVQERNSACGCATNPLGISDCYCERKLNSLVANSAQTASPGLTSASPGEGSTKLDNGVYIADGDYIKDIEVNDLRNRYTLTKGSTQKMVNRNSCHLFADIPRHLAAPLAVPDLLTSLCFTHHC